MLLPLSCPYFPSGLVRYLLVTGDSLPDAAVAPQLVGFSFPGLNLRVGLGSEGQLDYTVMKKFRWSEQRDQR